jgi:putative addiction module component (TIGR02574 family)
MPYEFRERHDSKKKGGKTMSVMDIPKINQLSVPEKILLVEELWDNIALDESTVPVPKSHMEELDRRFKNYKSNPGNLLSLEELQVRIE